MTVSLTKTPGSETHYHSDMLTARSNLPIGTPMQARLGRTPMIDGGAEHKPPGLGRP